MSYIQRDYKMYPAGKERPQRRVSILSIAITLSIIGLIFGFSVEKIENKEAISATGKQSRVNQNSQVEFSSGSSNKLNAQAHTNRQDISTDDPTLRWQDVKVKNGDNLSIIYKRLGLSAKQLQTLLASDGDTKKLTRLYPGDILKIGTDDKGQLIKLVYNIDEAHTLILKKTGDQFISKTQYHPLEKRVAFASGVIDSSLFIAAQNANLSDNLTMELAGIFGWDIDFVLDIRSGDSFIVIYEELYLNGEKVRDGNIQAAEFINRGKSFRAIRFTDSNNRSDYYEPNGKSLRKTFLRAPVDFSRISSRFSLKRKHPVLNRIRAHRGVDYSAPRGTPIRATGQGRVVHRGKKGGFGNTIIIQHGSRYQTLYAHMSKYARKTRYGKTIKQGQIIGYVGSTGLATGPHLHYEFRINGVHRNPLTVKLPNAKPLPEKYKVSFSNAIKPYLAQLDALKRHTDDLAATTQIKTTSHD